jgi:hypothetical protein
MKSIELAIEYGISLTRPNADERSRPRHVSKHVNQHVSTHVNQHVSTHVNQHVSKHGTDHESKHGPRHVSKYGTRHVSKHGTRHESKHSTRHVSKHGTRHVSKYEHSYKRSNMNIHTPKHRCTDSTLKCGTRPLAQTCIAQTPPKHERADTSRNINPHTRLATPMTHRQPL